MSKDPAFLLYSQDWIVGTQFLTFEEKGMFIDILAAMHQHGRLSKSQVCNIIKNQQGNLPVNLQVKFRFDDNNMMYNEKLEFVIDQRSKGTDSSRNNGKKGGRKPINNPRGNLQVNPQHPLSEDENESIVFKKLQAIQEFKDANELKFSTMIVLKMIEVWKLHNKSYPIQRDDDYSACLKIAYKLADLNNWNRPEVLDGKMGETVKAWEELIKFIVSDNWFSTRSLSDMAGKEWQRLIQKFNKTKSISGNKQSQEINDAIKNYQLSTNGE